MAADKRALLIAAVTEVAPRLGIAPTCMALGVSRATFYRRRRSQNAAPAADPLWTLWEIEDKSAVKLSVGMERERCEGARKFMAEIAQEGGYLRRGSSGRG